MATASTTNFIQRSSRTNTGLGDFGSTSFQRIENGSSTAVARKLPTDLLYNDWKHASPTIRRAIELMDQAIPLFRCAIRELAKDPIASDDAMNKVIPILTELFCCRQIGEGFATVVNALLCAVQNNATNLWQSIQLEATLTELNHLRAEPFLKFDQALDSIEKLERVELVPQPQGFNYLSDWLDGQSIR